MSKRADVEFLADSKEAILRINAYTKDLTYEQFLGDVNAVKKGKVGKRIARRTAGKATGKGLRKLFK